MSFRQTNKSKQKKPAKAKKSKVAKAKVAKDAYMNMKTISSSHDVKEKFFAEAELDREKKQNRAVCRVIFQALEELNLKHEQLAEILGVDDRTIKRWQAAGRIATLKDKSVREPASHFVAVYANLVEMFSTKEDREAWLKSEHPVLKATPLELMIESFENLANVRRY
ncbi:MAG: DUF2384 domain-containing protein, partial [Pseudobdellovibrionaceae bacterium]|nr:DUF2384 domain-containing protein [Pseudobdellovibrionaceae bacterium]